MDTRRPAPGLKGDTVNLAARAILLLACLLTALPAHAQVDLLNQIDRQAGAINEVDLRIISVGLNNAARPGEWAGIQIRLTDHAAAQRDVLLRVVLTDVDGDDALYESVVSTTPNADLPVWVYARIPFDIGHTGGFIVQAFAAEEAENPTQGVGYLPGRPLGQTAYRWQQNTLASSGLIGVVGQTPGGIAGYGQRTQNAPDTNPLGHEVAAIVPMATTDLLPDRWMGLAMLRELIWNGPSPANLRIEQVRALREWIERGGHLVIILPAVSQDWLALGNRELASILPRVEVNRLESEQLTDLRPLLTDSPADTRPIPDTTITLHTFDPLADAAPGEADRILNDAQGRCVVASRTVGIGAVTIVGIPGWNPALTGNRLPDADVFWHRVLGRRGHVATDAEFEEIKKQGDLATSNRSTRVFDQDINAGISQSGRSLAGVMLGLVVFIAYWLVAGPGGFAMLKSKGLTKHAWVAFLAAALAFTALAWGGASILRPKRVEVSHLSILDQVYGQRVQRVRSWASVLIPVYGDASIWLDSDDAAAVGGSPFVQAVAPWEPSGAGVRGSFPDAREYAIDSRNPDRLTFPARATVKQVQLDWAGGIEWESIRPRVAEDADPFHAVHFAPEGTTSPTGQRPPILQGQLIHNLPGALQNVQVIVFRRQVTLRAQTGLAQGLLLTTANAWTLQGEWTPGQVLDLDQVTSAPGLASLNTKLDNLVASGFDAANLPSAGSRIDRFEWLAFFNLFGAPTQSGTFQKAPVARREATHAFDLSRWSTRPSLVIIATLTTEGDDSMPQPIGIATNGSTRTPDYAGTTIVRWVYPLPDNPPEVVLSTPPDTGPATIPTTPDS